MAIDQQHEASSTEAQTVAPATNLTAAPGEAYVEVLAPHEAPGRVLARNTAYRFALLKFFPNGKELADAFSANYPAVLERVRQSRQTKGLFTLRTATEVAEQAFDEGVQASNQISEQLSTVKSRIGGILNPRNRMNGDMLPELYQSQYALDSAARQQEEGALRDLAKLIVVSGTEAYLEGIGTDKATLVIKDAQRRLVPVSEMYVPGDITDEAMAAYLLFQELVPERLSYIREIGDMIHHLFGTGSVEHESWTLEIAQNTFNREIRLLLIDLGDRLRLIPNPERLLQQGFDGLANPHTHRENELTPKQLQDNSNYFKLVQWLLEKTAQKFIATFSE